MRLTMLLVGVAALIGGIFSGTHDIRASAANQYGVVKTSCGSALSQADRDTWFPELREACSEAIGAWPALSLVLFAVATVVLIRLLYMLIGQKTPSN